MARNRRLKSSNAQHFFSVLAGTVQSEKKVMQCTTM